MKPGNRGKWATAPHRLRPQVFAPVAALAVLNLLIYSNSFSAGFVLDNRGLILNDPRVHESSAESLKLILNHTYWWPAGETGVYRPLTTLSYLFNYATLGNGADPAGYHWINFLLQSCNVLLVYALARRFIRGFLPAVFTAALWAAHPLLTESVINIAGRADLLAGGATMAALLVYIKLTESSGTRALLWLSALSAVTAAGIFSKENAFVIPFEIVFYELVFRDRRGWKRAAAGLAASLVPIAWMLYQRSAVLAASLPPETPFTDNPIVAAAFWAGKLTAVKVLARYLGLMVWPATLSADYSWSEIPISTGNWGDWLAAAMVLGAAAALATLYRKNRGLFFLAGFSVIWLAPVSNLIVPIGAIMAERFLYLPLLGAAACAAVAVYSAAAARAPVILTALIACLAIRSWTRNADWRDEMTIARASVRASPGSFKTHELLANVLFAADPGHADLSRVIAESEKSRSILDPLPDDRNQPGPYRFAATCYMLRRDYPRAIAVIRRFLAIEQAGSEAFVKRSGDNPGVRETVIRDSSLRQADGYRLLAAADLNLSDSGGARQAALEGAMRDPLNPESYRALAEASEAAGQFNAAAVALVEGAFVTSDRSLRDALVSLYRESSDPKSCALTAGPNGAAINPKCAVVHANLCGAAAPTIEILKASGQADAAAARKDMFVKEFGCGNTP